MFAVIKTGGKQYKVAKNDVLKIEKIEGEAGSVVVFDEVLAFTDDKGNTKVGSPLVENMTVSAEVIEQKKDDKVLIFKKKRRHNYRRKVGHRQQVAWIRIQDIAEGLKAKKAPAKKAAPKKEADTKAPAVAKETKKVEAKTEEKVAKKPAAKKTDEKKAAAPKTEAKKAPAKKAAAKTENKDK